MAQGVYELRRQSAALSPSKRSDKAAVRASSMVLSRKPTLHRGRSDYLRDEVDFEEEAKKLDRAINLQLDISEFKQEKSSLQETAKTTQKSSSDDDYDTDLEDAGKIRCNL